MRLTSARGRFDSGGPHYALRFAVVNAIYGLPRALDVPQVVAPRELLLGRSMPRKNGDLGMS